MEEQYKAQNPIKSVSVTLEIMEGLKELNGAGVTELAKHLDISKSRVHNYLSSLREESYVVKDGSRYDLGPRMVGLGIYARNREEIYHIAKPKIEELAAETGELVNLLIEENGRGVYLAQQKGKEAVSVDTYTGHRVYLHNTALGKAILAELPRDRVEDILDQHGMPSTSENTITNRTSLFEELDEIAASGVAYDDEERLPGLRCVASAVTDNEGEVHGAISITGPSSRMREERFREVLPQKVAEVSHVISLDLSYS